MSKAQILLTSKKQLQFNIDRSRIMSNKYHFVTKLVTGGEVFVRLLTRLRLIITAISVKLLLCNQHASVLVTIMSRSL